MTAPRLLRRSVLPASLVAASILLTAAEARRQAVPAGFEDSLVASVAGPTALAFTPDGRLLITTQAGTVRVFSGGALLATPALNITSVTCSNSERGLLGIAVDPAFAGNHFVYVYYTRKKTGSCPTGSSTDPVNRVSRFTLGDDNVIDPASELVLIDEIPSTAGNHNAGDVQFGKDGLLYVSVGDGGCDWAGTGCGGSNDAARDEHVLLGKILRITKTGGIPAGNPFQGAGTARCNVTGRTTPGLKCQETYSWGLRNPFRMAFDPNAAETRFFVNDVGQGTWEEIDEGASGADYGWNVREGHCSRGSTSDCGPPPAGMTNPIHDYAHSTGCQSITGGAFVPAGAWPAAYDGDYLFSDYVCGRIFRLEPNGSGGYTRTDFATGLGQDSAVHLTFGPHAGSQALYYTTYAGGGQVRRIAFIGAANRAPTADFDGDGKTDWSVWRPSNGTWYVIGSGSPVADRQWGLRTDVPVAGDYDGDGKTDHAVWRPANGTWYVVGSSVPVADRQWGLSTDIPVPGDYDGDGKTDRAVWRPSNGTWYVIGSGSPVAERQWGARGDVPVPGDYDGDGRTDMAVWRQAGGVWYVVGSGSAVPDRQWGWTGDIPVPGDYDGDGRTDHAVWRPANGNWYVIGSGSPVPQRQWGLRTDVPVPGDYDGDAKTDMAVWRPSNGTWYVIGSGSPVAPRQWGTNGDRPVPLAPAVQRIFFP